VSATPAEPGCAAATCLMAWFTSTNELHERVYTPYGLFMSGMVQKTMDAEVAAIDNVKRLLEP